MATIDELGRRAGRAVLEEAAALVDVDDGLDRITSTPAAVSLSGAGGNGRRGVRRSFRWTAVAASAAIVTGVLVVVIGGSGRERVVTEERPDRSTVSESTESRVRLVPSLADIVTVDMDEPSRMPAAVSPNGAWVAYQGPGRSVCLTSLTGTGTSWCEDIPEFGFRQLSWSPDSTRFTGGDEATNGLPTRTTVVEVDGSWTTLDLDVDRPLLEVSFGLDGDSIVAATPGATNTDPTRLVVVDADTGATRVLVDYPGQLGSFGTPFPIDAARSMFFVGATADDPDAAQTVYVLDADGSFERIAALDGGTLPRTPIGVTSTVPPVVLMLRARPVDGPTTGGGVEVAFRDVELLDVGTGEVTRLPPSPSRITPFSAAISPDGKHVAMAWTTDDGVLELGVARIDELVTAGGVWDDDAWAVETLADDGPLGSYVISERRPVCWCGERLVVIARDDVYMLDLEAISEIPNNEDEPVPD